MDLSCPLTTPPTILNTRGGRATVSSSDISKDSSMPDFPTLVFLNARTGCRSRVVIGYLYYSSWMIVWTNHFQAKSYFNQHYSSSPAQKLLQMHGNLIITWPRFISQLLNIAFIYCHIWLTAIYLFSNITIIHGGFLKLRVWEREGECVKSSGKKVCILRERKSM